MPLALSLSLACRFLLPLCLLGALAGLCEAQRHVCPIVLASALAWVAMERWVMPVVAEIAAAISDCDEM